MTTPIARDVFDLVTAAARMFAARRLAAADPLDANLQEAERLEREVEARVSEVLHGWATPGTVVAAVPVTRRDLLAAAALAGMAGPWVLCQPAMPWKVADAVLAADPLAAAEGGAR